MRIIHSSIATKGLVTPNEVFDDWISEREANDIMRVGRIRFDAMKGLHFTAGRKSLAQVQEVAGRVSGDDVVVPGELVEDLAQLRHVDMERGHGANGRCLAPQFLHQLAE